LAFRFLTNFWPTQLLRIHTNAVMMRTEFSARCWRVAISLTTGSCFWLSVAADLHLTQAADFVCPRAKRLKLLHRACLTTNGVGQRKPGSLDQIGVGANRLNLQNSFDLKQAANEAGKRIE